MSRRAIVSNSFRFSVSSDTLIRRTPIAESSPAYFDSSVPLVVSVSSFSPLPRCRENRAISSITSFRTSGSPPVIRSLSTPNEANAVTSSSSSSNDSTSLRGRKVIRSGMQ